jgi:ABC-type nitrate/sulfonate/bicarbonate transport system permease component
MAGQFAALILLSITGFVLHAIIKHIGNRVVFWGRAKEGSTN